MSTLTTPIRAAVQAERTDHPTSTATLIGTALVALAGLAGLALPLEVALAIVTLTAVAVSIVTPRYGDDLADLARHPAGLTGAAVAVLVYVATLIGVELDPTAAAAIVGASVALVSRFFPRWRSRVILAPNVPEHGGTGPDPVDRDTSEQGEGVS